MAYVRMTLLRPRPGAESEVLRLLESLDASLAESPALLFSLVMQQDRGRVGRISLWQSKDEGNREAVNERTLSLRSRLRLLSIETEETFMEVKSGFMPDGFNALSMAMRKPAHFPSAARQKALLAS